MRKAYVAILIAITIIVGSCMDTPSYNRYLGATDEQLQAQVDLCNALPDGSPEKEIQLEKLKAMVAQQQDAKKQLTLAQDFISGINPLAGAGVGLGIALLQYVRNRKTKQALTATVLGIEDSKNEDGQIEQAVLTDNLRSRHIEMGVKEVIRDVREQIKDPNKGI